jgi:hypothetical protein
MAAVPLNKGLLERSRWSVYREGRDTMEMME